MQITYLGHSAFEINTNNKKILIDPFLIKYPNYNPEGVTDIFVTHGHGDHLGNAIEISRKTGAKITAIFELANYCNQNGAKTVDIGFGSWINYDWGKTIAVPSTHTSSTPNGIYSGTPCGFIFNIDNTIIYHAGDTGLNSDMKIIGEIYKPEIAMLPIGGKYTMDIEHAVIASKWIDANTIIPMHYNTFDAIKVDIKDFEHRIQEIKKKAVILEVGQSF